MTSKPSVTGGACIIASVCVGAGMLGLPSAGAGAWTLVQTPLADAGGMVQVEAPLDGAIQCFYRLLRP